MKYRIVKRGNKYIPQCRFLWIRWDYAQDENGIYFGFGTQKEAEEFIEEDLIEEDIVVKTYSD